VAAFSAAALPPGLAALAARRRFSFEFPGAAFFTSGRLPAFHICVMIAK